MGPRSKKELLSAQMSDYPAQCDNDVEPLSSKGKAQNFVPQTDTNLAYGGLHLVPSLAFPGRCGVVQAPKYSRQSLPAADAGSSLAFISGAGGVAGPRVRAAQMTLDSIKCVQGFKMGRIRGMRD